MSEDAGIAPSRTVATLALKARRSNHSAGSHQNTVMGFSPAAVEGRSSCGGTADRWQGTPYHTLTNSIIQISINSGIYLLYNIR